MIKKGAVLWSIVSIWCMSCVAQVSGSLQGDGQADIQIYAALEPRMTMLITGLAAASGTLQPEAPILDAAAISASLAASPGVASVSLKNSAPAAIEGPLKIARLGDFLSPGMADDTAGKGRVPGFITFEQSDSTAAGRCTININRDSGPAILALISPDMGDYLGALMAPLATGEVLTKTEYTFLLASVYGRGIADEISRASINAFLDFPGKIQSVKGGKFSGRRAEFAIPLLDVLVLETPLSYEVVWK